MCWNQSRNIDKTQKNYKKLIALSEAANFHKENKKNTKKPNIYERCPHHLSQLWNKGWVKSRRQNQYSFTAAKASLCDLQGVHNMAPEIYLFTTWWVYTTPEIYLLLAYTIWLYMACSAHIAYTVCTVHVAHALHIVCMGYKHTHEDSKTIKKTKKN